MKKRILSMILTLALCLSMLPAVSLTAAAADTDKAIMWGVSGIGDPVAPDGTNSNALYTYDYVYWGTISRVPIHRRQRQTRQPKELCTLTAMEQSLSMWQVRQTVWETISK